MERGPGNVAGRARGLIVDPDDAAGMKKAFENSIPLGRYADPIEIAQLVQFLASDESKFITGTTQVIDGGMNA